MRRGDIYLNGPIKVKIFEDTTRDLDLDDYEDQHYHLFVYTGTSAATVYPEGWYLPTNLDGKMVIYRNASTNGVQHKMRSQGDTVNMASCKQHGTASNRIMLCGDSYFGFYSSENSRLNGIAYYEPPL